MNWITEHSEYYEEKHHHIYGRPWAIGLDHYLFLKEIKAIGNNVKFLDIGCGSMRTGIHVANEVGLYIGVDSCKRSLDIAKHYEMPMYKIPERKVHLFHSKNFKIPMVDLYGIKFETIFSFSVLQHLSKENLVLAAEMIKKYSHKDTIIVTNHKDYLSGFGFQLVSMYHNTLCKLIPSTISWFIHKKG